MPRFHLESPTSCAAVLPHSSSSQSISSTVAFGFGCSYFARYEQQGVGIQWHNIGHSPMLDDDYNMLSCICMMLIDTVIYGLVAWYVEAVFPGRCATV